MLAKRTTEDQITLPKSIIARFGEAEYFDVSTDGICITLRPLQVGFADQVRDRLAEIPVQEQDVSDAIAWARLGE